jgi:hypothetical protein
MARCADRTLGTDPGIPAADRFLCRSNPRYVLRGLDDLDPSQRDFLIGSSSSPAIAGLLFPVGDVGNGTVKAVSPATASLFERFAAPGWLPSPLCPALSGEELGELVGAEVLEIQVAGRFLTGIEALAELFPGPVEAPDGRLAALSLDAIAYAESLGLHDQAAIAGRLYSFHRVAIRASWRTAEYGDAFRAALDHAMPNRLGSDPRWSEFRQRPWRAHRRRGAQARPGRPTLKLYISPATDCLPDAVAASIPLIREAPAVLGWKVASSIETMVRPDKFVVYLESRPGLRDLADELSAALAGAAVHGVPFTCDAGLDGLLSWGVDPPSSPHEPASLVDSWRTWVAARLAGGLVQARWIGLTGPPAHAAALLRARAVGIDTRTWQARQAPAGEFERGTT